VRCQTSPGTSALRALLVICRFRGDVSDFVISSDQVITFSFFKRILIVISLPVRKRHFAVCIDRRMSVGYCHRLLLDTGNFADLSDPENL